RNYLGPTIAVRTVALRNGNVRLSSADVQAAIGTDTAAIYLEAPSFLGTIDPVVPEACRLAHVHGALAVVGADPISLGVLRAPASYGADITVGELQPLGVAMQGGTGLAGFIASSDDERFVREYPTFLIGLTPTSVEGELGFGFVAWDRTNYVSRED